MSARRGYFLELSPGICQDDAVLQPNESRVLDAAVRQGRVLGTSGVHTVAAAAMDTQGRVFTGVNVHHFSGGPCAELVALGAAAAQGAGPVVTVAAVGDQGRAVLPPCGRCRQVLLDLHPDCFVVMPPDEEPTLVPVRKLLPDASHPYGAAPERFIRFSPAYFENVREGLKTQTIRYDDPISLGPAWLVFEFDTGYRRLRGNVEHIAEKRMDEIDEQDVRNEAMSSTAELHAALRHHYPSIEDDAAIRAVSFRVTGES